MINATGRNLNRRELLTRTAPACAMACLGLGRIPAVWAAEVQDAEQEGHKFDVPQDRKLSPRGSVRMQYGAFIDFVRTLQIELEEPDLIRLLNANSTASGRRVGEGQAARSADNSFETFVATFRPPRYATTLTHEVVEDTENAFELRVTECVWASVFREAGMDGEIGHAAVCNMDYAWPTAFNPNIKMERDRTLMQGHDHCNHRYVYTAESE